MAATTGTATREKRFRITSSEASGRLAIAANGASAPIQKATPAPCRKTIGRVNHCGCAVLACPLAANEVPTPRIATADSTRLVLPETLNSDIIAKAIATMAISKDGARLEGAG